MFRNIKIEASVACANFKNLEKDIRDLELAGVDYLHIDIMDGSFVPNFALDFSIMKILKEITQTPMECHLMIEKPERYIDTLAEIGVEYISVHVEAVLHLQRLLSYIKNKDIKTGVAFNPATPVSGLAYVLDDVDMVTLMTVNPGFSGQSLIPSMMNKIAETRSFLEKNGYANIEIQVDGNVSFENIPKMVDAGATMLVGGTSSVFHKEYSIAEGVAKVRDIIGSYSSAKHKKLYKTRKVI